MFRFFWYNVATFTIPETYKIRSKIFEKVYHGGWLVEAQTDIQTYIEQGNYSLAQGQAREAAIAYAHGAQIEPNNPAIHLGLAEANLALGNYGVVQMACKRIQELQPTGGIESIMAQALLDLLDHRYAEVYSFAAAPRAAYGGVRVRL